MRALGLILCGLGASVRRAVTASLMLAVGLLLRLALRSPLLVSLAFVPSLASARAIGISSNQCLGCHGSGQNVTAISVAPLPFSPGATVTVTVSINGSGANGGLFLAASHGLFTLIPAQSTRLFNNQVLHSTPRAASAGKVTFEVSWTAPTTPGAVDFEVYTVMGNANGSNTGDAAGLAQRSFFFGCAGTTYYRDNDRDGVGATTSGSTINCAVPPGYSTLGTDCDDGNPLVKPGAVEACNGADDNCNGQIDEGLTSVATWPDADNDGYGAANGSAMTGCAGGNRAPNNLDCNDLDPALRPGTTEVCNFRDDDCDGQYDEGVYAKCGVGWCLRTGTSCDSASCTPAPPLTERCNRIDDDCDGLNDEGDLCAAGQVCLVGECIGGVAMVDAGTAPVMDAGSAAADAGVAAPDAGTPEPVPARSCAAVPGLLPLTLLLLLRRRR